MDKAISAPGMLIPGERVSLVGARKLCRKAGNERKVSLLDLLDHRHLALGSELYAECPDMAADALRLAECVGRMKEAARGGRLF